MKRIMNTSTVFLLLTILWSGCDTLGPANTDITTASTSLSFEGKQPSTIVSKALAAENSAKVDVTDQLGATVGTITLLRAHIVLTEIKLKLSAEELENAESTEEAQEMEDENNSVKFMGPYVVNLLNDTVEPSIEDISIPVGEYKEMEMKLHKINGNDKKPDNTDLVDAGDPLFDNSIYLEGTYSGASAAGDVVDIPFYMAFDLTEKFELTNIDAQTGLADSTVGLTVATGGINPIIVAFRLAEWFAFDNAETNDRDIDFNSLVITEDNAGGNEIRLDSNAGQDNKDIRKVIKDNIKESADYGKDNNGDGNLDDDEDDDPDTSDN